MHVDLEARLLHQGFCHRRKVGQHLQIGGVHQHHRSAVVAGFLQQLLGLLGVGGEKPVHSLGGRKRCAADEQRLALLDVCLITDGRHQEVLLIEGVPERLANLRIVERLLDMVGTENVLRLQRRRDDDRDIGVLLQRAQQIVARLLDEIDFALGQRVDGLLRVGDRAPLDAIDLDDLAAGHAGRRLTARFVLVELDVDGLVARPPFILLEDEGAGSREILDLLVGVGFGDALGHHERHVRRGFG